MFPEMTWRRLESSDLSEMMAICSENTYYYNALGTLPTEEGMLESLEALPPGTVTSQKHFYGFFYNGELRAIVDIITGWPEKKTGYIGLMMLAVKLQGRGLGALLFSVIRDALKDAGYERIRLGCLEDNKRAYSFWIKCGFIPTGKTGEMNEKKIIVLERDI